MWYDQNDPTWVSLQGVCLMSTPCGMTSPQCWHPLRTLYFCWLDSGTYWKWIKWFWVFEKQLCHSLQMKAVVAVLSKDVDEQDTCLLLLFWEKARYLLFSNIWSKTLKAFFSSFLLYLNDSFRVCCAEGAFRYTKCMILFPLFFSNPSLWKYWVFFTCGSELPVIDNGEDGIPTLTITAENYIHPDNGMLNGNVYV